MVYVVSVEEKDFAGFVYDVSTLNGTFGHVSGAILKNTDSVYVKWRVEKEEVNMHEIFRRSGEAADFVSSHFKAPMYSPQTLSTSPP